MNLNVIAKHAVCMRDAVIFPCIENLSVTVIYCFPDIAPPDEMPDVDDDELPNDT